MSSIGLPLHKIFLDTNKKLPLSSYWYYDSETIPKVYTENSKLQIKSVKIRRITDGNLIIRGYLKYNCLGYSMFSGSANAKTLDITVIDAVSLWLHDCGNVP